MSIQEYWMAVLKNKEESGRTLGESALIVLSNVRPDIHSNLGNAIPPICPTPATTSTRVVKWQNYCKVVRNYW